MEDTILQVLAIAASAIALSFGLARLILRQNAEYIERQARLMMDVYHQLEKRLARLEHAILDLSEQLHQLMIGRSRRAGK